MAKRVGANTRKRAVTRRAEIHKGLRRSIVRIGSALVICTAAGGLLYAGTIGISEFRNRMEKSDLLNVKEISVKGSIRTEEQKIIARCGLRPGMKLYSIKKDVVKSAVSADPWVKSVKLKKKLYGRVIIEITERDPVALVNFGTIMQVDEDGVLLPLPDGSVSLLPLVSGLRDTVDEAGRRVIDKKGTERLNEFLREAGKVDGGLFSRFSQLDLSHDYMVRLVLKGVPSVIDIGTEDIVERLNQLLEIEKILSTEKFLPARINLCYQNLAYVTQRSEVEEEIVRSVAD